jgi:hypothetical protein
VVWLTGSVPSLRRSELVLSEVSYAMQRVDYAGTNAIDSGRQRFQPGRDRVVKVTVALHSLTVTARDLLFNSARGEAVVLVGPDGSAKVVPFSTAGAAHVRDLPRGSYRIDIRRPEGIVRGRQLTLSGDATVNIPVLGWSALGLIAGIGLLVALALPVLGRRVLRRRAQ